MFAVIKAGGKQYRVAANDRITLSRLQGEPGDTVAFDTVLMMTDGDTTTLDAKALGEVTVAGEIVEQARGEKVIAFKKRRRQNSRRKRGQRHLLSTVRISEILTGGAKPSKKAAAKPAAKAEAGAAVEDVALISGVGPALKAKLAEAGITTLAQIAALKKKDVAKLDEDLALGGRVEREEWVAQAKDLIAGKPPRAKIDQEAAAESAGE